MMRHASVYRLGGYAVFLGALCFGAGILLHAPQPADLAAYGAVSMGPWMASHWLIALGAALMAGGVTAYARHMSGTAGEGWSVLGFGIALVSTTLLVAVVAPEIGGFGALLQMNADGGNVAAQNAFIAINAWVGGLASVAGPLFWVGIGFFALAMLRDSAWPRWVAPTGLVVAIASIASNWVLTNFTAVKVVSVIAALWLAATGILFSRFGAGQRPGVAAPADAYRSGDKVPTR